MTHDARRMTGFKCAFKIRSDTRYLDPLRQWVSAALWVAEKKRISCQVKMACTMALIEAVNNAIFHAHRKISSKPIGVCLDIDGPDIKIEVTDRGRGIGRQRRSDPSAMREGGRGLFLIHSLMTSVISRMRDGEHVLQMKLNCGS